MGKIKLLIASIIILGALSACATIQKGSSSDTDRIAQTFFNDLQKLDRQAAYGLFAKGLSQRISFEQFDQLMKTMESRWGKIVEEEAVELPFHKRPGENDFIPFGVTEEQIKRYVFEVKYNNAEMNCALTIVPQEGQYKIVWISFWGSNVYLTPDIREKLEKLFSRSSHDVVPEKAGIN